MSDYIIECVEDAIGHLLVVPEFAEEWQRLRARLTPDRERVARCGDERHELDAYLWKRRDEWVLELNGSINGTSFTVRHTEPASTPPEDAVGLPSLYAALAHPAPVAVPGGMVMVQRADLEALAYTDFGRASWNKRADLAANRLRALLAAAKGKDNG